MFKDTVTTFFKSTGQKIIDNSPAILTGIAVVGAISAVVMAVKATPAAMDALEEDRHEREKEAEENNEDPSEVTTTWKDAVRVCWKLYLPTTLTLTTSIAGAVASNYVSSKRAGALATAFAISQETFRTYQDKVIEEIGKKKEEGIRDKIAKDKAKASPYDGNTVILSGNGNYLFYDSYSGRYFRTDISNVDKAKNELNSKINNEMYATVNDFYDILNLRELKRIDGGESLGWSGDLMDYNIHATVDKNECNGEPYIILTFTNLKPFKEITNLYS